jgi:hypothetical protein
MAILRNLVDAFWITEYYRSWIWLSGSFINTWVYIYMLFLAVPGLTLFFLKAFWKIKVPGQALHQIYYYSTLIWITYPLVGLITLMDNGSYDRTVAWFKYLPFFAVEHNFFPTGMIAVIPVLFFGYFGLLVKIARVPVLKTGITVFLSLLIIYLLYYQYLFRIVYYLLTSVDFMIGFGFYTFSFIIFGWLFLRPFSEAYGKPMTLRFNSNNLLIPFFLVNSVICVMALLAGLMNIL